MPRKKALAAWKEYFYLGIERKDFTDTLGLVWKERDSLGMYVETGSFLRGFGVASPELHTRAGTPQVLSKHEWNESQGRRPLPAVST